MRKLSAVHQIPADMVKLADQVREYRKATRMSQWVLAKVVGVEEHQVREVEMLRTVPSEVYVLLVQYLATAPRPRKRTIRAVSDAPKNIYLTTKLMTWAKLTNMDTQGLEAVRALRDAYERAKQEQGLASIPLIQLEVENALTLATRGAYRRMVQR